ncbi:hypothetical protein ILYODFUR_038347 [Ilyodon furcidens]|uniref:Uncharacterized protein n=1 Tax=Ilyodon furcidens TaxID=33524 RepID=A0ABV0TQB8_9TELE
MALPPTSVSCWIFCKVNIPKLYHLTGCHYGLSHHPPNIFDCNIEVHAGKSFKKCSRTCEKILWTFCLQPSTLSCLGSAVSECSLAADSGTKTFIVFALRRLISRNQSVFIFQ